MNTQHKHTQERSHAYAAMRARASTQQRAANHLIFDLVSITPRPHHPALQCPIHMSDSAVASTDNMPKEKENGSGDSQQHQQETDKAASGVVDQANGSDSQQQQQAGDAPKDKYNAPEEIKKQKLRDRKKNKRKRKRQQEAVSKAGEKKEGDEDDSEEEEHKEHPLSIAETVKALKAEYGDELPKKKVYGIQMDLSDIPRGAGLGFDPVMDKFARSEGKKEEEEEGFKEAKKQHKGLRCIRCFSLLCRDDDFEYMNGQLNVTGESLKRTWDGLITRGGMVYCQKMHLVGYKKNVTFTNQSRSVVVLKVEKTTFTDNYLNNPAYAGTDKIKNRLQFQERGNEGLWRQLSLPPEQFIPKEFAPADRYHGPGAT